MTVYPLVLYITSSLFIRALGFYSHLVVARVHTTRPRTYLFASSINNHDANSKTNLNPISQDVIEEIKAYADIVSVIESYDLPFFARSADGYRGKCLCPFHNDRNPSLNIDNSKGIYKCFSCGAGGDVFNFVREYDFISNKEKGQKMSYPAAILKVANEFCGGDLAQKVQSASISGNMKRNITPEKMQKIQAQNKKRERILLANSIAADFYARSLISNPAAGSCRSHLRERGITPTMVRTFALGYAPDAYFGSSYNKDTWGRGSLVERLKECNFTAQEIVDAGLATVTAKARSRLNLSVAGDSIQDHRPNYSLNGTIAYTNHSKYEMKRGKNDTSEYKLEHDDLMDRFRRRLMVPIFDVTGVNVVGFGGRHLETDEDKNVERSFVAAKYLNSPDTLVFAKRDILYGLHSAVAAMNERTESKSEGLAFKSYSHAIVIVEGYFDAIALHGAGIREVVASMGTALTIAQISLVSNALGRGGKIVLCLDNDEAGVNAMERICIDSNIWTLLETNGIDLGIASLPFGIKDPAEFIEKNGGAQSTSSGDSFRDQVLKKAVPWNDWYTSRLISKYDASDSTSFSSVCDYLSTFFSTHPNAAERTKMAYEAAGKLADIISRSQGSSSNGPLKIQLESDLLGMASRKAAAREALARRIEAADGEIGSKSKILKLSSGEPTIQDDARLVSRVTNSPPKVTQGNKSSSTTRIRTSPPAKYSDDRALQRRQYKSKEKGSPPITSHFNGFQFSPTDAEWLGITTEKGRKKFVLGEPKDNMKPVYFNSNEYLGNEKSVLSKIAMMNDPLSPAVENASNPLVKPDETLLLRKAESRLLYTMIHYTSARLAMKSALLNQIGGRKPFLEWSSLDREWLFQCLTESPGHEQLPSSLQKGGTPLQLKQHLMTRPDVPDGAFGTLPIDTSMSSQDDNNKDLSIGASPREHDQGTKPLNETMRFDTHDLVEQERIRNMRNANTGKTSPPHSTVGTLDELFQINDETSTLKLMEGSASHEERAELTVQEAVAIMLKASAMRRLMTLRREWESATLEHDIRASRDRSKDQSPSIPIKKEQESIYKSLNDDELLVICNKLGQKVADAMKTVRELTESANQLNKRLLDYCAADGVEGRMNHKNQQELAKALDEYVASLPDDPRPQKSGANEDYIFGIDEYDVKVDARFGGKPAELPSKKSESMYDSIFE